MKSIGTMEVMAFILPGKITEATEDSGVTSSSVPLRHMNLAELALIFQACNKCDYYL